MPHRWYGGALLYLFGLWWAGWRVGCLSALPEPALFYALSGAESPADRYRHRRTGAPGNDRHYRPSVDPEHDPGGNQKGRFRNLLC